MKRIFSIILVLLLLFSAGCNNAPNQVHQPSNQIPENTVIIDPTLVDAVTENWMALELAFKSSKAYNSAKVEQFYVDMDVIFTHRTTGESLNIPAFWDGDNIFAVRFAPTEVGLWDYKTVCATDESLDGIIGTVGSNTYLGDLDVYKNGFVKTNGKKYFVYDNGTPFFYLGDTHWTMFTEEFDEAGPYAGNLETDSHFKYIVDKRVEQGYTVYQSEPIGAPFDVTLGFTRRALSGFKKADLYFQYIAKSGLTHANAQFFFATAFPKKLAEDTDTLEQLCRYWVARFGAYPVMWTLGQEVDNDMYKGNKGDEIWWDHTNNPWITVAEYLHKYDAYSHPLSGHQEGSRYTSVTGAGTDIPNKTNQGASVFLSDEVTEKTGHDWWAAQWKYRLNKLGYSQNAKDYWNSSKVAVNYEDNYCYLWTEDFGARARGWISYLYGFFGYGYGCIDIWYYRSNYEMNTDSDYDGVSIVTPEEKKKYWPEAVELESGYQVGYMRQFFESFEWWKLVPDFEDHKFFYPQYNALYACATIDNDLYVIYLYGTKHNKTGFISNMDENATYTIKWYNPRTNTFEKTEENIKANTVDVFKKPAYLLDDKPDKNDWVVLITKNK